MNLICPQCNSKAFKRNGYTRHGKQNHRCLDCGRQFSHEPTDISYIQDEVEMISELELLSKGSSSMQSLGVGHK
jgi:DNA-directed RNA polymerase subunit RPC12/RpoP